MRRIVSLGLVLVLSYLIYTGIDTQEYNKKVELAAQQAQQGARFTANDGRKVCAAILSIEPKVKELLPAVCFSGD